MSNVSKELNMDCNEKSVKQPPVMVRRRTSSQEIELLTDVFMAKLWSPGSEQTSELVDMINNAHETAQLKRGGEEKMDIESDGSDEMSDGEFMDYLANLPEEEQRYQTVSALLLVFTKIPEAWSKEHPKENLPPAITSFAQHLKNNVEPIMSLGDWVECQQHMIRILNDMFNAENDSIFTELLRKLLSKINEIYVNVYGERIKDVENWTLQQVVELETSLVPDNKPGEKSDLQAQLVSTKLQLSQLKENSTKIIVDQRKDALNKIVQLVQQTCQDWKRNNEVISNAIEKFIDLAVSTPSNDYSKHWEKCQKLLFESMKSLTNFEMEKQSGNQKRIDVLLFNLAQSIRDLYLETFHPIMFCDEYDTFLGFQELLLNLGLPDNVVFGDIIVNSDYERDEEHDFDSFTPQKRAGILTNLFCMYAKICDHWINQYNLELPHAIHQFGHFCIKVQKCQQITPWFWKNIRLYMQHSIIRSGCPDTGCHVSDDAMKERYLSQELLRNMNVYLEWFYGENFEERNWNEVMMGHLEALSEPRATCAKFEIDIARE